MLPRKGLYVKFTDSFFSNSSSLNYGQYKDTKLLVTKLALASSFINNGNNVQYEVTFTDGKVIDKIIVDNNGKINGCNIFESWINITLDEEVVEFEEMAVPNGEAPRNNDGRQTCYWCGAPTRSCQGFMSNYDVCTSCGK